MSEHTARRSAEDMEKTTLDRKSQDHNATDYLENVRPTSTDTLINAETEKCLNRKFDRHILPWLFLLWLLAFIDRSNIGNARIDGLAEDLKLDGNKFNIALAVFYVPYICIDVCIANSPSSEQC
jgi:hypothetical protein